MNGGGLPIRRATLSRFAGVLLVLTLFVPNQVSTTRSSETAPPQRGGSDPSPTDAHSRPSQPTDTRGDEPSEQEYAAARTQARQEGRARVVVGFKMLFRPEGGLSSSDAAQQRESIRRERSALDEELRGTGHRVLRAYSAIPFVALELPEEAIERMRRSERVASVAIDELSSPVLAQSGPLVQADQMWTSSYTGHGQTVAILDTGVEKTHPFFGGRVVEEACYSAGAGGVSLCPGGATSSTSSGSGADCPTSIDGCGHGTHVAGIAAGASATFSGVARQADIMAVKVFTRFDGLECTGVGQPSPCVRTWDSDWIAGLNRVYERRSARTFAAVNMSLGGGRHTSVCDEDSRASAAKLAMDNLLSANIATVVSSGNEGYSDAVGFPACISTAITVGSSTKEDGVSSFSNGHPTMVDLMAPGSDITSSVIGGGFGVLSGTSMAAPHVTGAWALVRSKSPIVAVSNTLASMRATGVPITDPGPASGSSFTTPRIKVKDAAFLNVPGVATLVAPSGTITNSNPSFVWTTVSTATHYRLQISRTGAVVSDAVLTASDVCSGATCARIEALVAGAYSWRVRARNAHGDGEWSGTLSFTINAVTPPVPQRKSSIFVPLDPCRIADTRVAGGAIGDGATRFFNVVGVADYLSQGGSSAGCGVPGWVAGRPRVAAAALRVTVVTPAGTGVLRAFPGDADIPASGGAVVNYTSTDPGRSFNTAVLLPVRQDSAGNDVKLLATRSTHVTIDVTGYQAHHAVETRITGDAPNVVGGDLSNVVSGGVIGATISGGGDASIGTLGPQPNVVTDDYGSVAGGAGNRAGDGNASTTDRPFVRVGGGLQNVAAGAHATIGGGAGNLASGFHATVPGGFSNKATGDFGFAAGRRASVVHQGARLFADSTDAEFLSVAPDEFAVRASGGVSFLTSGDESTGCVLPAGGAEFACSSDRHVKRDSVAIDAREIAESVAFLPLTMWRYRTEGAQVRHLGPMSEDFFQAFGLGGDAHSIAPLDEFGVALAAIKGLLIRHNQQVAKLAMLRVRRDEAIDRLVALRRRLARIVGSEG